jgi:ATP-binding cassette subfamily F protein uup
LTAARPAQPTPRTANAPAKLSFKEQRRLAEAEALVAALPQEIARWELTLTDAGLYARDPSAFATATEALEQARVRLAEAEETWLELEARREALAGR